MIHHGDYTYTGFKGGSLAGCPDEVTGWFDCQDNELISLAGAPSKVGGDFYCSGNELTSLVGAPSTVGGNFCGNFYCDDNELTSLADIHKQVKSCTGFFCYVNEIKSNILGLLLITNLKKVGEDGPAFEIINKWLGQGKLVIFRCQKELIDAGYEEYARL